MDRHVTLICGPPVAGKTTLAKRLAQPGDLILDLDTIAKQLGSPTHHPCLVLRLPAQRGGQPMPTRPCLGCQRLTTRTRCTDCTARGQQHTDTRRGTTAQRGYDSAWRRLVVQAKQAQRDQCGHAWCVDCGLTEAQAKATDNPLSGEHLHWPARTVDDVLILCRRCNSRRGPRRRRVTASQG